MADKPKFKLKRVASAAARAFYLVAVILAGQSNLAGDAMEWCGPRSAAQAKRATSLSTGETDPLPGCKNTGHGGGSGPYLIDDLWGLGIRARVFDMAIGGAGVADYTGRAGAVVQGDAAKPTQLGYMDKSQFLADGVTPNPNYAFLSGGALPVAEGHADFDKFGLLARIAALISTLHGYDAIWLFWLNGESDAGNSAEYYTAGLVSLTNYAFAHGVHAVWLGFSSRPETATNGQYDSLELGRAAAVQIGQDVHGPVFDGCNLWLKWKDQAPLYPEARGGPRVHLVLRGQWHQAKGWYQTVAESVEMV